MDEKQRARQIVDSLGGPAKVAGLLGWPKHGGTQRVQNWLVRGIPSSVKVMRPDLFMPELVATPTETTTAPQPADDPDASQPVLMVPVRGVANA